MNKKLLPFVWMLGIISIISLTAFLKLESTHFFGIAENHEQTISFSYPVEIVQTFAVDGGEVRQGKQILEVRRRDLGTKLVIIKDQIKALKSAHSEELASTRAKLAGLRAQQAAELAQIDAQIQTLRSQQNLNQNLLKEITGTKTRLSRKSPLETRIQGLLEQRGHIKVSLTAQMANLQNQLNASERPVDAKISELKERESEFNRQVTALQVVAKFNGRVGSVNYKPGEIVEPYQPILTVHGLSPKYIKGYIHENVYNQVAVGQKVWVRSNTSTTQSNSIHAVVESLGNRIVEYPVRLKKNVMVSAWGREAVIRLTEDNALLLGEKVVVTLEQPEPDLNLLNTFAGFFTGSIRESIASSQTRAADAPEGYPIRSLIGDVKDHDIEASGIIQAGQAGYYFIVSDKSTNSNPELYKLNDQGEVTELLPVLSKEALTDLSSTDADRENIYVLAFLNPDKLQRNQLLRLQMIDDGMVLQGRIDLYKMLEKLSQTAADMATRQLLQQALSNNTINIEAHSVYQNDLYLGFKSPLNAQGETVFIKLDNIDPLFDDENNTVSGSIWRSISLLDPQTGSPTLLSDMLFYKDQLLLLGVNESLATPSSHLWSYQPATSSLNSIQSFDRLQAGGISGTSQQGELMLVFDGSGSQASRFLPFTL